jgi:hypothetical protein
LVLGVVFISGERTYLRKNLRIWPMAFVNGVRAGTKPTGIGCRPHPV